MTATNVTRLKPNQIFVFGSNLNGWHAGGAASQAKYNFGAIEGKGEGLQGQSYALPTIGKKMNILSLGTIQAYVVRFRGFAKRHPELEFILTPIGTGIAGYKLSEIKSILPDLPSNVTLVGNWGDDSSE